VNYISSEIQCIDMKVKQENGTRLQYLPKKKELFRRKDGEPRYMPKSDMSLEDIRRAVNKKKRRR
jgi:hypothetical protein